MKKWKCWSRSWEIAFSAPIRGFLVNLQEVARYDNSNIELKNGESVFLAKQKYNDFVTAYMKYLRKV